MARFNPLIQNQNPASEPAATAGTNAFIAKHSTPSGQAPVNASFPKSDALTEAIGHLNSIKHFIGRSQRAVLLQNFKGEEKEWFFGKIKELAELIDTMPATGDQDGRGKQAIAYLRYFTSGRAAWHIIEKDKGSPDDAVPGQQHQAFGLADIFGDGGEMGYISIEEILQNDGELDFHFTPQTLDTIRNPTGNQGNFAISQTEPKCLTVEAPMDVTQSLPAWRQRLAKVTP